MFLILLFGIIYASIFLDIGCALGATDVVNVLRSCKMAISDLKIGQME